MDRDKKLWKDFKNGESYALTQIYYQNVQLLYRYGKKFTFQEEIIKDTIQDLFFDLIRLRANLTETDNIRFYLITSFRRKLLWNLQREPNADILPEGKKAEIKIIYSVEDDLINKEDLTSHEKLVRDVLNELSPKMREIIFYKFICEFDYDEICKLMDLKYDSARKQVFRALKALKTIVTEQYNVKSTGAFMCFLYALPLIWK